VTDALYGAADERPNKALGSKERHLRVICDGTNPAEGVIKAGNTVWAISGIYVGEAHEFDRRAERIAARSREEATQNAIGARTRVGHS
jgi:hypothetical protein